VSSGLVCLCKEASFTYPRVAVFARQVIYLFEHNNLGSHSKELSFVMVFYDENSSNVCFGGS